MRQNDAGMKRNGQEWYRNVPERAGMTPEYTEMRLESTRIWSAQPEKGKCDVLAFVFFFNGGRGGISRTFREHWFHSDRFIV